MPGKKHLRGVSEKEQRQYEHIKETAEKSGRYGARAKEVAARTVMKAFREGPRGKESNPIAVRTKLEVERAASTWRRQYLVVARTTVARSGTGDNQDYARYDPMYLLW